MLELIAPETAHPGEPIPFTFRSDVRVSGRLRLTAGTEALEFTLQRADREAVRSSGPRMRGKEGAGELTEWGDHPEGSELVLRFEGAKAWIRVLAPK